MKMIEWLVLGKRVGVFVVGAVKFGNAPPAKTTPQFTAPTTSHPLASGPCIETGSGSSKVKPN
jgi:hypothetical protein